LFPDWHQFHADQHAPAAAIDSRRRLRICLGAFLLALAVVFGRAVQLEITEGAAFRAEATRPLERRESLPGLRGRILARDGVVLACDRRSAVLAVHYRYLEQPADPAWLRRMARSRLTPAERKEAQRVAAEEEQVLRERAELARRLAELCGISAEEWDNRARRIQTRVERIAASHNRDRKRRAEADGPNAKAPPVEKQPRSTFGKIRRAVAEALRPPQANTLLQWEPVAEQHDYHPVSGDLPLAVVAEIEGRPQQYPGVRIVEVVRRHYPQAALAAHALGHMGPVSREDLQQNSAQSAAYHSEDYAGRAGLEKQYESLLRARRGEAVELTDHSGHWLSTERVREPGVGRDLILTLDSRLQRTAETLLDDALKRRELGTHNVGHNGNPTDGVTAAGGAVVVMDVRTGAIRAAASAPRFDPGAFVAANRRELEVWFDDPRKPLFDRTRQMAIPPGSVFKTVSAVALLEAAALDPAVPFYCQGYLRESDRQRCAVYRQHGVGHGNLTLRDALARSCNVYFFHHAGEMGPVPLLDWAERFGFGHLTGVDLPGESPGRLPMPQSHVALEGREWLPGDTYSLWVGQGSLTATPLQVARMMAAVANGGNLVTPHLVSGLGLPERVDAASEAPPENPIRIPAPRPISGLKPETLDEIRDGLERVVCDHQGTAHGTVHLESIAIAGKTGTAQTGGGRAAHAWFAGYVPAENPKLVIVVALEHSGDAATTAGPVVKRLVLAMQQFGLL